jgi:hypothetical protein
MQILLSFVLVYGGIVIYFVMLHFGIYRRYPIETYLLMMLGVLVSFHALRRRPGWRRFTIAAAHAAVLFIILGWTLIYSRLPLRPLPISVGHAMPAFSLPDQDGRLVSTEDIRGKTAALFVFYRGYW